MEGIIAQDIQLISLWEAPKSKDTYVVFHDHNCYELVYYVHGRGKTVIGEISYHFTEGSFAVIPPCVRHDELHDGDGYVICLEFRSEATLPLTFCQDALGVVAKILKDLFYEIRYQKYGYKDMISVKLNELYLHILRNEYTATDEKNLEYAASKAAQTNMMQSLALQLAKDGITVNNVAPGVIYTDRNVEALSDETYAAKVRASIPVGFYGEPKDIAELVRFLCGPQGRYITGQSIFVDGGKSIL